MGDNEDILSRAERQQLQEETERINEALAAAGGDSDSEDDQEEQYLPFRPLQIELNPDYLSDDSQPARVEVQPETSRHASPPLGLTLQGQVDVDDDTCLQLNRSYQRVIMENQRCIALVIAQNRDRQNELEQELQLKVDRASGSHQRKPLKVYSIPYFKDVNQSSPPDNEDVQRKKETGQVNTNTKVTERAWYIRDKTALKNAVKEDAMKRKMQPLLSRKEILCEKLKGLQEGPEKTELEVRVKNVDIEIEHVKKLPDFDLYGQIDDSDKVDWLKIAAVDLNGRHSAINCELYWRNSLHPLVNTRRWTKEEDDLLQRLVLGQQVVNWQWISRRLKTGRSAYMCLQRYQQKFNEEIAVSEWTPEEDQLLLEVVNMCKVGEVINWAQVNYYLEGHNGNDCRRRYFQIKPDLKRGRFSQEEDEQIMAGVKKFGQRWQLVATAVPGRSGDQCRERWSEALSDSVRKEPFSYQEDRIIWLLHNTVDPSKWTMTAKMLKRTDAQVMRRFQQMKNYEDLSTHIKRGKGCAIGQLESKRKQRNKPKGIRCELSVLGSDEESPYSSVEAFLNSTIAHLDQSKRGKKREDEVMMNQDLKAGIIVPRPPSYTHKRHYCSVTDHREMVKDIIRTKASEMQMRMPDKSIAAVFTPENLVEKLPERIQEKIFARETLSRKRDIESITKAVNQLAESTRPWLPGCQEKDKEETEIDEQLSFIYNSTFIQKGKIGRRSYKMPVTEEQADFQLNQAVALYIKALGVDTEQAKALRESLRDEQDASVQDETPSTSREETDNGPVDQSNVISQESAEGDTASAEDKTTSNSREETDNGPVGQSNDTSPEAVEGGIASVGDLETTCFLHEALQSSESESPSLPLNISPSKCRRLAGQTLGGTPRCPVEVLDSLDAAADISFGGSDNQSIVGSASSLPPSLTSINAFRHMLLQRRQLGTQKFTEGDVAVLRSSLLSIRDSPTYQTMKRRFHSAFLWPAFLSHLDMPSKATARGRVKQYRKPSIKTPKTVEIPAQTAPCGNSGETPRTVEIPAETAPCGNSGEEDIGSEEDAGNVDVSHVRFPSLKKTRTRQVKRVHTYSEELDAQLEREEKRRREQRWKTMMERAVDQVLPAKKVKKGGKKLPGIQAGKDSKRRPRKKPDVGIKTKNATSSSTLSNQMGSVVQTVSSMPAVRLQNENAQVKKSQDSMIRAILNSKSSNASAGGEGTCSLNGAIGKVLSSAASKQVAVNGKATDSIQTTAQPGLKHKAIVLKLPASAQPFQMSSDVLNQLIAAAGLGSSSGPLLPSGVSIQLPASLSGPEKKQDNTRNKPETPAALRKECSS